MRVTNLKKEIIKPIFVIGMPRSGTTVISEAISVHEDLGWFSNYLDKLPFLPEVSLLSRLADTQKIGIYLRGKKKQNSRLSASIRRLLPYCSEAYSIWERYCGNKFLTEYLLDQFASEKEKCALKSLIGKILYFQGKKRFLAKLTGPPRINYINSIFPDAFFVQVIRDPRAVISSLFKVSFWKQGGGFQRPWWQNGLPPDSIEQWVQSGKSPVVLAAVQWNNIIEVAWHENKVIDRRRYIELRYEDFVRNPYKALDAVFGELDLPSSQNVQRYIHSIAKVKNMNQNFRRNLSAHDIKVIEEITIDIARKLGYVFS